MLDQPVVRGFDLVSAVRQSIHGRKNGVDTRGDGLIDCSFECVIFNYNGASVYSPERETRVNQRRGQRFLRDGNNSAEN